MRLAARTRLIVLAAAAAWAALPAAATANVDKKTAEALESYFDFIDYDGGTITAR